MSNWTGEEGRCDMYCAGLSDDYWLSICDCGEAERCVPQLPLGQDFGMTPMGTHQIAARFAERPRDMGVAGRSADCCGDPADCQEECGIA